MAQKRMFDKAIIDTDRFMDLPMTAKAIYFLLGMEADDEGFVSYKKVMRIHGGQEDDINVLAVKNFIIKFPSGVIVITEWAKNNWLDNRRIRQTEYKKEREMLVLTEDKKYVLSNRLASIEENRIEENRIEENRERVETKVSPKNSFDSLENEKEAIITAITEKTGLAENIVKNEIDKFISYWTESNQKGKQRWQMEKVFDIKRRLGTWFSNFNKYNKKHFGDNLPKVIKI